MAMTGISGLRAIGKSQDQELSLEEVGRAFFYTEWYGNCPFTSILDSSVAAQPFEGIQLSSLWRFGSHLASEDMAIVVSSARPPLDCWIFSTRARLTKPNPNFTFQDMLLAQRRPHLRL